MKSKKIFLESCQVGDNTFCFAFGFLGDPRAKAFNLSGEEIMLDEDIEVKLVNFSRKEEENENR